MKKLAIILSLFAFVTGGCKQATRSQTEIERKNSTLQVLELPFEEVFDLNTEQITSYEVNKLYRFPLIRSTIGLAKRNLCQRHRTNLSRSKPHDTITQQQRKPSITQKVKTTIKKTFQIY
jgi:hypothetical protein